MVLEHCYEVVWVFTVVTWLIFICITNAVVLWQVLKVNNINLADITWKILLCQFCNFLRFLSFVCSHARIYPALKGITQQLCGRCLFLTFRSVLPGAFSLIKIYHLIPRFSGFIYGFFMELWRDVVPQPMAFL